MMSSWRDIQHWLARALSVPVIGFSLFILVMASINEDPPRPEAFPLLALLGIMPFAVLAAWRWQRAGGVTVIVLALAQGFAAFAAQLAFGLDRYSFLFLLLYGLPPLCVGVLFLSCGLASRTPGSNG